MPSAGGRADSVRCSGHLGTRDGRAIAGHDGSMGMLKASAGSQADRSGGSAERGTMNDGQIYSLE